MVGGKGNQVFLRNAVFVRNTFFVPGSDYVISATTHVRIDNSAIFFQLQIDARFSVPMRIFKNTTLFLEKVNTNYLLNLQLNRL